MEAECWLVSSLLVKLATLFYGPSDMYAKISFKILEANYGLEDY